MPLFPKVVILPKLKSDSMISNYGTTVLTVKGNFNIFPPLIIIGISSFTSLGWGFEYFTVKSMV